MPQEKATRVSVGRAVQRLASTRLGSSRNLGSLKPASASQGAGTGAPSPRAPALVALALFVVTLVVYLPVGGNEFVNFDTPHVLTENPDVYGGFTKEGVSKAFTEGQFNLWLPLTTLSHMLDVEMFGLNPRGHHLMNAAVHAGAAAALLLTLFSLTRRLWPSALAAAFFAVHPLRVESVAWAAERKDTLGALFWILTMWAYAGYVRAREGQPASFAGLPPSPGCVATSRRAEGRTVPWMGTRRAYALLLVVFALALMTKPTVVTLPFALLLLDAWPLNRVLRGENGVSGWLRANRGLLQEKLPLVVGVVALSWLTIRAQSPAAVVSLEEIPLGSRLSNALVSYVCYLTQTVWPADLCVFYPLPVDGWGAGVTVVALAAILTVTLVTVKWRTAAPWFLVGWLWFLGTLVPNIGLIQSGVQARADRFTYVPSIGLALVVAWGAERFGRRWRWSAFHQGVAVVVVLAGLCGATRAQIGYWRDSVTLFARAVAVTRANPVAQHNLATAYLERGRSDLALEHFERALKFDPGHVEANIGAAVVLAQQGRAEEALRHYREALKTAPDNLRASTNLGNLLAALGQPHEALTWLEHAHRIAPDDPDTLNNLGLVWAALGDETKAVEWYGRALELDDDHVLARQNLAVALLESGQLKAARREFEATLQRAPNMALAMTGLGLTLKRAGDLEAAVARFREALRIDPAQALARSEMIASLLALGRHRETVQALQRAIGLEPDDPEHPRRLAWLLAACPDERIRRGELAERAARDLMTSARRLDPRNLDLLAAALAEQGRFADAAVLADRAREQAAKAGLAPDAEAIQRRLELYRKGAPFRLKDAFP